MQSGVLSSPHRLTSPADFREVVRRGRRSGGPLLVVHLRASTRQHGTENALAARPPRVGFVVSKAVGGAVVRNRVKRRLRHLARDRTGWLLGHDMLVVRALPGAANASYDELRVELDRCLARLGVTAERAATKEVGR